MKLYSIFLHCVQTDSCLECKEKGDRIQQLLREKRALAVAQEIHRSEIQALEVEVLDLQAAKRAESSVIQNLEGCLAFDQAQSVQDSSWEISRDELDLTGPVLGVGAWGSVMKGTFRSCPVAVKQIHNEIMYEQHLSVFRRETAMAARLRHPCLVQFIGGATDRKVHQGHAVQPPLIVSELLETDLRHILPSSPTQEDLKRIGTDIALGLNFLHLAKPNPVVHRDISSANVLLHGSPGKWRGKLSDLGSANFQHHCQTAGPGNAIYSAPEATDPEKHTSKMDVYSFGVLLVEMYSPGPWTQPGNTVREHRQRATRLQSRPLRESVLACLRDQPKERPSAEDVLSILKSL